MSLPAIPEAQSVTPAQIDGLCGQVEAWAAESDDVHALKDGKNRLAAIDEYLKRTSTEGRQRMAAAMRRLEVRIGELVDRHQGVALPNRDEEAGLTSQQLADFRNMAEHADTVEDVIANSTDDNPASRRQVIAAIRDKKEGEEVADRITHIKALAGLGLDTKSIAEDLGLSTRVVSAAALKHGVAIVGNSIANEQKWQRVAGMADQNYTSRQVAKDVGMTPEGLREGARAKGIEFPADAVTRGSHRIDHNRVVTQIVLDLEASVMTLDVVGEFDADDIDTTQINDWVTSLEQSLSKLRSFKNQLKEMTQ